MGLIPVNRVQKHKVTMMWTFFYVTSALALSIALLDTVESKRCWMVETQGHSGNSAKNDPKNIFSDETLTELRRLRKKIEKELEPWGTYGKISEIEFEFENDK